jgi:hypothetical protein
MIISGELPDSSFVTADSPPAAPGLTYSVTAKPLPAGASGGGGGASGGGLMGALKRSLEPMDSAALDDDEEDADMDG